MQKTQNKQLSAYIQEELLEKLEESDIDYHKSLHGQQYLILRDIFPGSHDDFIDFQ